MGVRLVFLPPSPENIYGRFTLGFSPESNLRRPHLLEVAAFSQVREAVRKLFSASVEFQMSSAKTMVIPTLGF